MFDIYAALAYSALTSQGVAVLVSTLKIKGETLGQNQGKLQDHYSERNAII